MRTRRFRKNVVPCVGLLAVLLVATSHHAALGPASSDDQLAAAPAQKLALNGVPNFGRVTENLYRGGQPTEEGFRELKKLGIEIVVNFRDEPARIEEERQAVEALGLRPVSIPWSSWHRPKKKQVAEFLELLRANPKPKIFVHCHRGADRTGVMVAAFRMALQGWTPPQALTEMRTFNYHRFWYPHLRRYVQDFPQQWATDPVFRTLQPAAHDSPR